MTNKNKQKKFRMLFDGLNQTVVGIDKLNEDFHEFLERINGIEDLNEFKGIIDIRLTLEKSNEKA